MLPRRCEHQNRLEGFDDLVLNIFDGFVMWTKGADQESNITKILVFHAATYCFVADLPVGRTGTFWVMSFLYTTFCNIYIWLFLANVREVQWVSMKGWYIHILWPQDMVTLKVWYPEPLPSPGRRFQMAQCSSGDFVPGAACNVNDYAPVLWRSHIYCVLRRFSRHGNTFFCRTSPWRGTGFATQTIDGHRDPHDHVELVVVLPSFFEKAGWLVVSRWKASESRSFEKFLLWSILLLVFHHAELWLEQKMGWWSRWACTKIMIISSIISIKGRCSARIAIRSPCSSPLFVSFNSAHIEFLFTFRSKMDSLKCLLPFPLALSACAFLNLLWNPFGISYFILTSEGRFSSLMPFQTLCFCSLSGTLPRLAEQKLCRRIQAQWQEEVDEDNDDQGDRNDSEAEAEDFNRGILDEWVVSQTGLRCDVKNQALNYTCPANVYIYIHNYIWL